VDPFVPQMLGGRRGRVEYEMGSTHDPSRTSFELRSNLDLLRGFLADGRRILSGRLTDA
jgi:hypothetical protein